MNRTKRIPRLPPPPPPAVPASMKKGPTAAAAAAPKPPPVAPRPMRKVLDSPQATAESVRARLLALPPCEDGLPALWRREDFPAELSPAERPLLDAALTRLQAEQRLVALRHGKDEYFAFAVALNARLAPAPVAAVAAAPADAPAPAEGLMEVYRRLVRESGGFPDVKIAQLARGVGPTAAHGLPERLTASWRVGDAVLSLGDWSLANEETRAAALELDGEKYLLVRFAEA